VAASGSGELTELQLVEASLRHPVKPWQDVRRQPFGDLIDGEFLPGAQAPAAVGLVGVIVERLGALCDALDPAPSGRDHARNVGSGSERGRAWDDDPGAFTRARGALSSWPEHAAALHVKAAVCRAVLMISAQRSGSVCAPSACSAPAAGV
jgi:hypothetical protein